MKKMYLAIFLIILVALVFAGCLSFSGSISTTTTESDIESEFATDYNDTTDEAVTGDIAEITTDSANSEENTTTSAEATTAAPVEEESTHTAIENPAPVSTDYNILKSGTFYMTGTMIDKTAAKTPMEVAITPDTIYMLADFSGVPMGMLISGEKLYMIYPAKKAYLELSDTIMNMAGLDMTELVNSDTINFKNYGDLSSADKVTEVTLNGKVCQVYHFTVDGSESRVYMDNTKLVRLASYDSSGKLLSATDIASISSKVPADKSAPPSSYKAYKGITGMVSFMTLLEGIV